MAEWTEGRTEGGFETICRTYDKNTTLILKHVRRFLYLAGDVLY